MAAIHLMCGFIGMGKTTVARKLAVQLPAVLLSHDEVMRTFFGRNPPAAEFQKDYEIADGFIWSLAEKIVSAGGSVIFDHGFWTKEQRKAAAERAKVFCENVHFHCVECDIETAKKRVLERTQNDKDALFIDEACFDSKLSAYEPPSPEEGFDMIFYRNV